MKKILFASTALLAAGAFASSAQASDPIKLSLGGYMEYYVVAADQDDDASVNTNAQGFDVIGDAEVFFKGKTTLDNGMTVGVDVQLEAGTRSSSDAIDESYMYIQGKYGKLIVGAENDVAYKMGMSAPSVSMQGAAGNDDSLGDYLLDGVSHLMVVSTVTGDANKLSYISPRLYGVQVGASYSPSNPSGGDDTNSSITEANSNFDAAYALAANYVGKFEGVGVKVGVAYSSADAKGTNVTEDDASVDNLNVGASVSYMGFTVGGAYFTQKTDDNVALASSEGDAWNVGVQYKEGPYGVSLTYYNSEVEGSTTNTEEDEMQIWQLAGTYALGKGVDLVADVSYKNSEDETGLEVNGNEGAMGAAVGLKLKF